MLPVVLSSQQNIEFTKENFPDKKSELKVALKNLEKGNSYYLADDFIVAADYVYNLLMLTTKYDLTSVGHTTCYLRKHSYYWDSMNKLS